MSLSEEKMLILKMLEEGKITSAEAAKLIEALDGKTSQNNNFYNHSKYGERFQQNINDKMSKVREKISQWEKEFEDGSKQKYFDDMVDEFTQKAEKISKNIAATTVGSAEKVVDFIGSFIDTNAFNIFRNFETKEISYEASVNEGANVKIEGRNGNIIVKKHDGDKILVNSRINSPLENTEDLFEFISEENNVSLSLKDVENTSVSHEVLIPSVKFEKVELDTKNGKIMVEGLFSNVFECVTKNGNIDLMGISSSEIKADTKNGRIQATHVIGKNIDFTTSNSNIDLKNIKLKTLRVETKNARILADNLQNNEDTNLMKLNMFTTNANIKVNMNDTAEKGYKVSAKTTNGEINLLIPDLLSNNNQTSKKCTAEAESNGYDNYTSKVDLVLETSNGNIEIVK